MLTIGTGVGGAIIVDGKLLRGGFGLAAELGHVPLNGGDRPCGCGQVGCIEPYGSGTSLLKAARQLAASGEAKGFRLAQLEEENGELTGAQVYQAIVEQDAGALELLSNLGTALGKTVAGICAVLDPEVVIIGGGVSAAGELILNPIRESYEKHLSAAAFRPHVRFAIAQFVNDAGVVGAADLARLELGTL
jgi:glucokinase